MTKKTTKTKEVIKIEEAEASPEVAKVNKKADYSAIYDQNKTYDAIEAIAIVRKLTKTKFDSSLEVHLRLGINTKKSEQQVRGTISLPNGTGKTVKVAAFVSPENEAAVKAAGADFVGGEELVNEIKKSEKTDFQVAIAEPALMKNLGVIAKILGTRGLMPSPKNDTVTQNPVKAVEELKKIFPSEDLAKYSLRWVLMNKNVGCVIPGASSIDQVIANSAASDMPPFSKDQMDAVERIYENYIKSYVHLLW